MKILIDDKNYHGLVNELGEDGKKVSKYIKQYEKQGWDDTETWNLYFGIAKYVLPRLKRFREIPLGHPICMTAKEWDEILGKMIWSFEAIVKDDTLTPEEDYKKMQEGLDLFAKWFRNLWT